MLQLNSHKSVLVICVALIWQGFLLPLSKAGWQNVLGPGLADGFLINLTQDVCGVGGSEHKVSSSSLPAYIHSIEESIYKPFRAKNPPPPLHFSSLSLSLCSTKCLIDC